jgi:hypothetical protein
VEWVDLNTLYPTLTNLYGYHQQAAQFQERSWFMATQSEVKVTDYDFATGEITERDATPEEIASWAEAKAGVEALKDAINEA